EEAEYTVKIAEKDTKGTLVVEELPVEFTMPLKDVTTAEKATTSLQCEVSKPDQIATWFKNGEPIEPDETYQIAVDGVTHTLTVKNPTLDEEAEYTVKIADKDTTGTLFVEEAPVEFTVPLKDSEVEEKETVALECEVTKADLTAKWYKDGQEIKPDERYEIRVEGTKHFLIIKDSKLDDEANYTVNIKGKESQSTVLVNEEPVSFTVPLKDKEVMEKEEVTLECEVN
ncbi:unnamed protein product, partial [Owenia fusiformis]